MKTIIFENEIISINDINELDCFIFVYNEIDELVGVVVNDSQDGYYIASNVGGDMFYFPEDKIKDIKEFIKAAKKEYPELTFKCI